MVHVPSNLPSAFALGTAETAEATHMLAKMKARVQWLFMGYLVFGFSRFRPVATLCEGAGKLRKPIFLPDVSFYEHISSEASEHNCSLLVGGGYSAD
jgi:hypothetical protein